MTPTNGNRVTVTDVYNIVGEYRKEVSDCLKELRVQNTTQGEAIARLCEAGEATEKHLDTLDRRDRLGTIVSGIGIGLGTFFGVVFGPKQ